MSSSAHQATKSFSESIHSYSMVAADHFEPKVSKIDYIVSSCNHTATIVDVVLMHC